MIIALYHTAQALGGAAAARLLVFLQAHIYNHIAANHAALVFQFNSDTSCCGR
jgi:hypothetical protein